MTNVTVDKSRKVANPTNPNEKITRVAHVTHPVVAGEGITADLNSLMNFAAEAAAVRGLTAPDAPVQILADLVQEAVTARVNAIAYNELGKSDVATKQLVKAIDALKKVPGFDKIPDSVLREMILSTDEAKQKFADAANVPTEISMDIDVRRLFTDARRKDSDESEESDES